MTQGRENGRGAGNGPSARFLQEIRPTLLACQWLFEEKCVYIGKISEYLSSNLDNEGAKFQT